MLTEIIKCHGSGNEFVMIDLTAENAAAPRDLGAFARELCGREESGRCDGALYVALVDGLYAMRMFNPDGSEAEMCGNGIRCVAKYIYDNRIVRKQRLTVETLSGIKTVEVHAGLDDLTDTVTVDMGLPRTAPAEVPVLYEGDSMVEQPVATSSGDVAVTAISMGNPHGIIFVDNFDNDIVGTLGPELENHRIWPERANIEFVHVDSDTSLSMRAWERGAGETMACGTGACAAAVAAVTTGRAKWPLTVRLIGGNLHIDRDPSTGHILMTGPAVTVYTGAYYPGC